MTVSQDAFEEELLGKLSCVMPTLHADSRYTTRQHRPPSFCFDGLPFRVSPVATVHLRTKAHTHDATATQRACRSSCQDGQRPFGCNCSVSHAGPGAPGTRMQDGSGCETRRRVLKSYTVDGFAFCKTGPSLWTPKVVHFPVRY